MTTAVFGSAFNPPHRGHMTVISTLSKAFDRVLVVPSFKHAFGKDMQDFDSRLKMTTLAINEILGNPSNVFITDIERQIAEMKADGSSVFSIDLLDFLHGNDPNENYVLAVGPDNADPKTFSRFKESERILREFGIHCVSEIVGYRSTDCRKIINETTDISFPPDKWVDKMGKDVSSFILENQLYGVTTCCRNTTNKKNSIS